MLVSQVIIDLILQVVNALTNVLQAQSKTMRQEFVDAPAVALLVRELLIRA